MANEVRKQNKSWLEQIRNHAAKHEYMLENLEKQYAERYPEISAAMHLAREMNSIFDDLIQKINSEI